MPEKQFETHAEFLEASKNKDGQVVSKRYRFFKPVIAGYLIYEPHARNNRRPWTLFDADMKKLSCHWKKADVLAAANRYSNRGPAKRDAFTRNAVDTLTNHPAIHQFSDRELLDLIGRLPEVPVYVTQLAARLETHLNSKQEECCHE